MVLGKSKLSIRTCWLREFWPSDRCAGKTWDTNLLYPYLIIKWASRRTLGLKLSWVVLRPRQNYWESEKSGSRCGEPKHRGSFPSFLQPFPGLQGYRVIMVLRRPSPIAGVQEQPGTRSWWALSLIPLSGSLEPACTSLANISSRSGCHGTDLPAWRLNIVIKDFICSQLLKDKFKEQRKIHVPVPLLLFLWIGRMPFNLLFFRCKEKWFIVFIYI